MIGDKLKEIRERSKMNKKEFATFLKIKYTTYNNYETGAREPSSDFLILISERFDVSIDYMLGLKDNREILHSYQLKSDEYSHIKKYRKLDVYGKKQVDSVISNEFERVREQSSLVLPSRRYETEYAVDTPITFPKPDYLTGLSAGTGLYVFDDIPTDVIYVDKKYKDADFVIGVSGNSMEPTYYDGDKVAVKKTPDVEIGTVGVFMVEGNGYIKELGKDTLLSHNKEYDDISIDSNTTCIGKVLGKI